MTRLSRHERLSDCFVSALLFAGLPLPRLRRRRRSRSLKPIADMRTVWETAPASRRTPCRRCCRRATATSGGTKRAVRFDGKRFEVFSRAIPRPAWQGRQVAVRSAGRHPVDRHGGGLAAKDGKLRVRSRRLRRLDFHGAATGRQCLARHVRRRAARFKKARQRR